MTDGFKKCPYCGKDIKDIAIKCQYCLKFLGKEKLGKTTKECPFCLNEIDINETKCPFCDEMLDVKNEKKSKSFQEKKGFFGKIVSNARKRKRLKIMTYIFGTLTILLLFVFLGIIIYGKVEEMYSNIVTGIFVIGYIFVLLGLLVFIFYKHKFFVVCFFSLPVFIALLVLFLYFFIPLIPSFISDYNYNHCDVDCFVKKGFESYEKGDDYNSKQYFDSAFSKRKYGKNQGNIIQSDVIKIIETIIDIYDRSGFEEVSDGSYNDISTEVYFDTISYGNYLINIIGDSKSDSDLQNKCYYLLFTLCNTVVEFDYGSSRRIYFNILNTLSGSIPDNIRLDIYKGIILSDLYGIKNPTTSENDVNLYYGEIETSAGYALLIQEDNAGLYFYKGMAEFNQGEYDDAIIDFEKYIGFGSNETGLLSQAYFDLGMSYFVEGRTAETLSYTHLSKDAFLYFEKAENAFKKLTDIEKNNDNYRYLGAMCIKKLNNTADYSDNDYEICCNYWKSGMSLGLDTNGEIYDEYSKYCKSMNRYLFLNIDF